MCPLSGYICYELSRVKELACGYRASRCRPLALPPPLQVSTPLHTVDTCASLHTLSISLLFPSVIKIYLSTPPAILVEALFLQGTHLHIPLLEAACHVERPSLCHPTSCTLLLCRGKKCLLRTTAVQASLRTDLWCFRTLSARQVLVCSHQPISVPGSLYLLSLGPGHLLRHIN